MSYTDSSPPDTTHLDIHVEDEPDGIRVVVSGEVDMSTADDLRLALDAADRQSGGDVLLDFAGLRFIDSCGLRELLLAARRARRSGRRLKAMNTPPHIRRLFELTAIDQSIELAR